MAPHLFLGDLLVSKQLVNVPVVLKAPGTEARHASCGPRPRHTAQRSAGLLQPRRRRARHGHLPTRIATHPARRQHGGRPAEPVTPAPWTQPAGGQQLPSASRPGDRGGPVFGHTARLRAIPAGAHVPCRGPWPARPSPATQLDGLIKPLLVHGLLHLLRLKGNGEHRLGRRPRATRLLLASRRGPDPHLLTSGHRQGQQSGRCFPAESLDPPQPPTPPHPPSSPQMPPTGPVCKVGLWSVAPENGMPSA